MFRFPRRLAHSTLSSYSSSAMSTSTDVVAYIDGATLEGGGQLIRNSAAFSTLLGKPISVHNVRQNRRPNGLKPQHTTGLNLLKEISSASTSGLEKGSVKFDFNPGAISAGDYIADTKTAGSITLLLQASLPCLLFPSPSLSPNSTCASTLVLCGGTNALQAPQIDYTQHVFLPFLSRHLGLSSITLDIVRRGYYPAGGGKVRVTVPSVTHALPAVTLLERGAVTSICGLSFVAGPLPLVIAEEMRDAAIDVLKCEGVDPAHVQIKTVREPKDRAGSGIVLWAETDGGCVLGSSSLGQKGRRSKDVGTEAAQELSRNLAHGGCVDEYLQDQMIIFLTLAKGKSSVKTGPLTLHTKTAIWIAETLTNARFETTLLDSGQTLLTCEGIAYGDDSYPTDQ